MHQILLDTVDQLGYPLDHPLPWRAVLCDNCKREDLGWKSEASSQGVIMSQAYGRKVARGLGKMEAALDEVKELRRPVGLYSNYFPIRE